MFSGEPIELPVVQPVAKLASYIKDAY